MSSLPVDLRISGNIQTFQSRLRPREMKRTVVLFLHIAYLVRISPNIISPMSCILLQNRFLCNTRFVSCWSAVYEAYSRFCSSLLATAASVDCFQMWPKRTQRLAIVLSVWPESSPTNCWLELRFERRMVCTNWKRWAAGCRHVIPCYCIMGVCLKMDTWCSSVLDVNRDRVCFWACVGMAPYSRAVVLS